MTDETNIKIPLEEIYKFIYRKFNLAYCKLRKIDEDTIELIGCDNNPVLFKYDGQLMRIYSRGREYTIGINGTIDERALFKVLSMENDELDYVEHPKQLGNSRNRDNIKQKVINKLQNKVLEIRITDRKPIVEKIHNGTSNKQTYCPNCDLYLFRRCNYCERCGISLNFDKKVKIKVDEYGRYIEGEENE